MIPTIKTKVKWSKLRTCDISYARLLLNSTNLNDDMFKMGIAESPNCECSKSRETPDHLILDCELYKDQRNRMKDKIAKLWMDNKKWGCLNINLEMLVGPNFSDKVTREEDNNIKEVLFELLISINKNL